MIRIAVVTAGVIDPRASGGRPLRGPLLWCLLLMFLSQLAGCTALLTPGVTEGTVNLRKGSYRIDPDHASVVFKVNHMGLSTFVGRFNHFDATLDFDPKQLEASRLEAAVETASLDVNNVELEDTLRESDWFDCDTYPQAFFRTTAVEPVDDSRVRYSGELTLRGVTAPLVLEVEYRGGAFNMLTGYYTIGFRATATLRRSAFGMDKYIPMAGDEVALEIDAEFQRQ